MSIADWIRERTARNREKFRAEVMQEGFELGRAEGRTEGRAEGYHLGYDDGRQGNPRNLRRTAHPTPTRQPETRLLTPRRAAKAATARHQYRTSQKGAPLMPMNATSVSHIAICVRDLDESLKFYCGALGMSIVSDVIQDTTTGGLPHVYAHRRATRRQVRLAYANGAKPTLTMTSHPGEAPDGTPIKLDQVGISHISFTVPDPKTLAESLAAQGVPLAAPLAVWTNAEGKVSSFYVYDPDGILVQFDAGAGG